MLKQLLLLLISFCILSAPRPGHAETKVLTAEGTYTMGEGETMTFAESMALQKAKQMALEQAGTYVESYTKVQNYQLTADEIQTIAGGVLQIEVLDKTRTLVGDGVKFFVKIKATVTTDKVSELAQHIKGKNVGEEYKKLQDQYAELTQEIETWKQLIAKTPPGADRDRAFDQIREREKEFATIQRDEAAFFHRMIAGETLVTKALNEERERVAHLRSIQIEIDDLFKFILQGQSVMIGEPTISVVPNTEDIKIVVPVTLRSSQLPLALERAPKKIAVEIKRGTKYNSTRRTYVNVKVGDDDWDGYLLKRVQTTALAFSFHLSYPGAPPMMSCSISYDKRVSRIYDTEFYGLVIDETPVNFRIIATLPLYEAKSLKGVSSRFFATEEDPDLMKHPCNIEKE